MTSLAGTFRVGQRESRIMNGLRLSGVTVNAIAKVLGRSTSTVDAWTTSVVDNRRQSPTNRSRGRAAWMSQIGQLRIKCQLFLKGLVTTVNEALEARMIPVAAVKVVTETSCDEDAEEPA